MGVGRSIREHRERAGMSQEGLGMLLGVHPDVVDEWEWDERRPDPDQAGRLVVVLRMPTAPAAEAGLVEVVIEPPTETVVTLLSPPEAVPARPAAARRRIAGMPLAALVTGLAVLLAAVGFGLAIRDRQRAAGLEDRLGTLRGSMAAVEAARSALSLRLSDLEVRMQEERSLADDAADIEATLRAELAAVLAELQQMQAETERLQGEVDAMADSAADLESLRADVERLTEENELLRSAIVISSASSAVQQVALTIDDGGTRDANEFVLDTLASRDVTATLFPSGDNVRAYPELWRRAVEDGHELGNHTQQHIGVTDLSLDGLADQLEGWESSVEDALGYDYEARWFRPPYMDGFEDAIGPEAVRRLLAAMGYITALWDVETFYALYSDAGPRLAGARPTPEAVAEYVVSEAGPGSVVLLHFGPVDAEALPRIIDGLRARGLEPVSLSELLAAQRDSAGGGGT